MGRFRIGVQTLMVATERMERQQRSSKELRQALDQGRSEGLLLLLKFAVMKHMATSPSWGGDPDAFPKDEVVKESEKYASGYADKRVKVIDKFIKPVKEALGVPPREPVWHQKVQSRVSRLEKDMKVERGSMRQFTDEEMEKAVARQGKTSSPIRHWIRARKSAA